MEHSFCTKRIDDPIRVCFRLKQARESSRVSIIELSRRTKISKKHLIAIESCEFDQLPFAPIYKRHFICAYTKALSLDPQPFLTQYEEEEVPVVENAPAYYTANTPKPFSFFQLLAGSFPIILRTACIFLIILTVFGYLLLQVSHILTPPTLTIYAPHDGFVTDGNFVILQGTVEQEAELSINGVPLQHAEDGSFHEKITLSEGVNTLSIEAKKKHGKTTIETRHVIVRDDPQVSLR